MTLQEYEAMFVAERGYEKALRQAYGRGNETAARYDPRLNRATPELSAAYAAYITAQSAAFAHGAKIEESKS